MAKKKKKREIAVFIASPGDLAEERKQFRKAIELLNGGFGDGANVEFEALGWEDTLASTGRRNQAVINAEIDRCDVFFLVMHRRWGQAAPDAEPYSSYTEEEFHRALARWEENKSPEIFVFFKRVDAESEADAGPQLEKVLDFRKQLEETRTVLYRTIDESENAFLKEVDRHLRAYAKGELSSVDMTREAVVLPLNLLEEVEQAKKETRKHKEQTEAAHKQIEVERANAEALQLEIAEDAAKLAGEGMREHARAKFVKLIAESENLRVLYLAFDFFKLTGDLDSAFLALEKWLGLSGLDAKTVETAAAYGNQGLLYRLRGEYERAEVIYKKSRAIEEELGHKEGIASDYGNLGVLYQKRGELERAEAMFEKSLAINEKLGHKEGMANDYGNLGSVWYVRGEFERAEAMFERSLAIEEELGRNEGMASDYGNLGLLYTARGEPERAKAMYEKALSINEKLGRKEGMASNYGNLGNLYLTRGELDEAEAMFEKSLVNNEKLGHKEGIANNYGNLGSLWYVRGEFEQAEAMFNKALSINEKLGRKEGMASNYGNLLIPARVKTDCWRLG